MVEGARSCAAYQRFRIVAEEDAVGGRGAVRASSHLGFRIVGGYELDDLPVADRGSAAAWPGR
ncbi:hypothetical protein Raf01_89760 [Rugosimonospora africana]|uniref:Uncharacterized protein n=1 Tax=Rugosimonospora africana TaxID=556532 RepID=A0A8J3R2X6_9ACTN|nr:hypothetical protein Raf01_89760 [Rugosimonospora africana]